MERRVGPAGNAWKKIITRGGGGGGGGRGAMAAMPSLDAVDAPLRTIAFDALKDVAVRGLPLGYRCVPDAPHDVEKLLNNGVVWQWCNRPHQTPTDKL